MKKLLKKSLLAVLCVATCIAPVGCNKTAKETNETVVTIWTGNGHDKEFVNKQVAEWNETIGKEKGIKIEYTVQSGNMTEKIDLAMQNGTAPDIFGGGDMEKMVKSDQIIAYEDLPGMEEILERFGEYISPTRYMIDGKTYTIPKKCTTYGLIYNIDMFKAAGLVDENGEATPPKTLEELREYAKILTNKEKKEYGIIYPGKFSEWYGCDIAKMAVPTVGYISSYNPATGLFDTSGEVEVIKTHMGIKRDGSYYPDVEGLDNDPARAIFAEGKIGMKTAGSFDYGVLTYQFPAKINWGVAPYPVKEGQDPYKQHMDTSGGFYVNKKSVEEKGAEAIVEAIKLFYSDEYIKGAYTEGLDVPLSMDFVEGAEINKDLPSFENWKAFCELTSVSKFSERAISSDTTGARSLSKLWREEIWCNPNITDEKIEELGATWNDQLNEGIKKYQELYPEYDPTPYIDENWDASR